MKQTSLSEKKESSVEVVFEALSFQRLVLTLFS